MNKQCLGSSVRQSSDLVNYRESHRAGVQIPSEAPISCFSHEYLNKGTEFLYYDNLSFRNKSKRS